MKHRYTLLVILLLIVNMGVALFFNQRITVYTMEEKLDELITNNSTGYSGKVYKPEKYVIEQTNHDLNTAYNKLIESSDIIVTGTLKHREQQTNIITSSIEIHQVYKGNQDITHINIYELYWFDHYEYSQNPIGLLDPLYCPILEDKEYIFFLTELYPGTYTYTDKLFTKFPVNDEVTKGPYLMKEIGIGSDKTSIHTFDAETFYSSDILTPLSYEYFYIEPEDYPEDMPDYAQLYVDFSNGVKENLNNK